MNKIRLKVRQSSLGFMIRNSDSDKRNIFERPYINHLIHHDNYECQWLDIHRLIVSFCTTPTN